VALVIANVGNVIQGEKGAAEGKAWGEVPSRDSRPCGIIDSHNSVANPLELVI